MNKMPNSALDPFSAGFLKDPYSGFEQMGDAGEVVWLDQYQACAVARHEQVQRMLMDSAAMISHSIGDHASHERACAAVSAVLSRPALNRLYRGFAVYAETLVERLIERRSFDVIEDLALAFPLKVISDAIGLTESGRRNLITYSEMEWDAMGPRIEAPVPPRAEADGAVRWVTAQSERAELSGEGLGAAVYAKADAGVCTEAEAGAAIRSLLALSVTTTVNAIGNGIASLIRYPDQWRHLHADPSLAGAAFEESLRFESPIQTFYQTSARDILVAGTHLPKGSKIFLFLGAANRDRRRWERSDQFDIRRNTTGHVSFGAGMLACVGQKVTKLAAEILFATLARRVTGWQFVGDPILQVSNTVRGWSSLPVKVSIAARRPRPALWAVPSREHQLQ